MKFASLCILAYERPQFLVRSFESLVKNTTYPHERIVNNDGSGDGLVQNYLENQLDLGELSFLISNGGFNMGVGKSLTNCIGISEGDYIFKLDADLEYLPNWLEITSSILENNPDVGCCGLFNYKNYDPNDDRFEILEEREDCYIVSDFVNSGYGFKRHIWEDFGYMLGDDGWQQFVKSKEYKLAIPKQDVVLNFGFGANKSVYLNTPTKSEFPRLFPNSKLK